MRYIIAYDISNNKLRNRLVKILEKYGERTQYSVFEFDLTEKEFKNLVSELKVNGFFKKSKEIRLFIYKLKPHLVPQIKRIGFKPILESKWFVV